MDEDPELDQVISNALSLQDDYPGLYAPQGKEVTLAISTETFSGFPSEVEIQIPMKTPHIIQGFYSMFEIADENQVSSTTVNLKQEEPKLAPCNQDQLHLSNQPTTGLKRSLTGEELDSTKRIHMATEDHLPSTSSQKCRKRTLYSKQQTLYLKRQFEFNQYPDYVSRCYFSQITGIPEPRIQVWFQNRRARYREKPPKSQEN